MSIMLMILLMVGPLLLGFWAQSSIKKNVGRESQVANATGLSGAEVARRILDSNGLQDVEIRHTPGELSDHYDPRSRTVNLSDIVFGQRSVAAAAIAAHEVGHAIQHQKKYAPLQIRSALVPAATFGSTAFMPLVIIGMILAAAGSVIGPQVFLFGIALYAMAALFQVVTLPVEFDASRRANQQMLELGLVTGPQIEGTKKVLNSAAMTYVAGALAAIGTLLFYVLQFVGMSE
jgi:Zn-dependent membrane protease YugP